MCTGVRGCAACRDPAVRRAHGLHPRPELPGWVAAQVRAGAACVHRFDLERQCAVGVPGFEGVWVWPEFLSRAEAAALLDRIERGRFVPAQSGKTKQHFGARVNFKRRRLAPSPPTPMPDYLAPIEARLTERAEWASDPVRSAFAGFRASDVFVLRYTPQQGSNLDFHVDDTFAYGDALFGLSLESDSVLTFIPSGDGDARPDTVVRVPLPAGSAVGLFGPARTQWRHGLLAEDVVARRTSVTLRTLRESLRSRG